MREIEFIVTEPLKTYTVLNDRYELRPDKKYHMVQKLCFWILGKIGAYAKKEIISYKKHRIDTESFMERLFQQRSYIIREFNNDPVELLIGSEDYAEIMGCEEVRNILQFNTTYVKQTRYTQSIMGLHVRIIPWLRGIVVI